jgi:hypothetical protein
MEPQGLLDVINEKLGEHGSLTLETNVQTSDGLRLRVTWTRTGFDGQKRSATGYNMVECFRKVLLYEEEVDGAAAVDTSPGV